MTEFYLSRSDRRWMLLVDLFQKKVRQWETFLSQSWNVGCQLLPTKNQLHIKRKNSSNLVLFRSYIYLCISAFPVRKYFQPLHSPLRNLILCCCQQMQEWRRFKVTVAQKVPASRQSHPLLPISHPTDRQPIVKCSMSFIFCRESKSWNSSGKKEGCTLTNKRLRNIISNNLIDKVKPFFSPKCTAE